MEENSSRKTSRSETNFYKKKYQFFGKARTNSTDSNTPDDDELFSSYTIARDKSTKKCVKVHGSKKNRSVKLVVQKVPAKHLIQDIKLKKFNIVIRDIRKQNLNLLLKWNKITLGPDTLKILTAKPPSTETSHTKFVRGLKNVIPNNGYKTQVPFLENKKLNNQIVKTNLKQVVKKINSTENELDQKLFTQNRCKNLTIYLRKIDKLLKMTADQKTINLQNADDTKKSKQSQDVVTKPTTDHSSSTKHSSKSEKTVKKTDIKSKSTTGKDIFKYKDSKIKHTSKSQSHHRDTKEKPSSQLKTNKKSSQKETSRPSSHHKSSKQPEIKSKSISKDTHKDTRITKDHKSVSTHQKYTKKEHKLSSHKETKIISQDLKSKDIKLGKKSHNNITSSRNLKSHTKYSKIRHKSIDKTKDQKSIKVDKSNSRTYSKELKKDSNKITQDIATKKSKIMSTPLEKTNNVLSTTRSKTQKENEPVEDDNESLLVPIPEKRKRKRIDYDGEGSLLIPIKSKKWKAIPPSTDSSDDEKDEPPEEASLLVPIPPKKKPETKHGRRPKVDTRSKKQPTNVHRHRLRSSGPTKSEDEKSGSRNKNDKKDKSKKDAYWSPFEYVEVKSIKAPSTLIEEVLPLPVPPIPLPPVQEIPAVPDLTELGTIQTLPITIGQIASPYQMVDVQPLQIIPVEEPIPPVVPDVPTIVPKAKTQHVRGKRKIKYPTNRDIKRVRFCDTISVGNKTKKRRKNSKIETPMVENTGGNWEVDNTADKSAASSKTRTDSDAKTAKENSKRERRLRTAKKIDYSEDQTAFIDDIIESQMFPPTEPPTILEEPEEQTELNKIVDEKISQIKKPMTIIESIENVVQDCAVSSSSHNEQSAAVNPVTQQPIPKLKLKLKIGKNEIKKKNKEKSHKNKKSKKVLQSELSSETKDEIDAPKDVKDESVKDSTDKEPLPKLKIANINENGEKKLIITPVDTKTTPPPIKPKPKTKGELKFDVTKQPGKKRGPKSKAEKLLEEQLKNEEKSNPKSAFDNLLQKNKIEKPKPTPPPPVVTKPRTPTPPPPPPPPPPKRKEPIPVTPETVASFFAENVKKLSELNKNCNWGGIYEQAAYHFFDTTVTYYRQSLFNYWKNNVGNVQKILVAKLRPDQLDINVNVDNLFDSVTADENSGNLTYARINKITEKPRPTKPTTPKMETPPPVASPTVNKTSTPNSDQPKKSEDVPDSSPKMSFQNSPLNLADSKQQAEKEAAHTTNSSSVLQVPEVNKFSSLQNFYNNAQSILNETPVSKTEENRDMSSNIVVPQYVKSSPQTIIPTMTTIPVPKSTPCEIKTSVKTPAEPTSDPNLKFVVTNVEHIQKDPLTEYGNVYGKNVENEGRKYEKVEKVNYQQPEYQRNITTPRSSTPSTSYTPNVQPQQHHHHQQQQQTHHHQQQQQRRPETTTPKSYDVDHTRNLAASPIVQNQVPSRTATPAAMDSTTQNQSYSIPNYPLSIDNLERRNMNYFSYTTPSTTPLVNPAVDKIKSSQSTITSSPAVATPHLDLAKRSNFYYDMSKTYSQLQPVRSVTPDHRSTQQPIASPAPVVNQKSVPPPVAEKPKEIKQEPQRPPTTYGSQNQLRTTVSTPSLDKPKIPSITSQQYSTPAVSTQSSTERPSLLHTDFQQTPYLLNNYYASSYLRTLENSILNPGNLLLPSAVTGSSDVGNLFATDEISHPYQSTQQNQLFSNVDNFMINSSDTQSSILLPNEASMMQNDTNTSYSMPDNYSPTLLTLSATSSSEYHQQQQQQQQQQQESNSYSWDKPSKVPSQTPTIIEKPKEGKKYRSVAGRYDETPRSILTLQLDHSKLFSEDMKFAKNYSSYLKEQIKEKYPFCHPLIGNTRLNKMGSAKVYCHCMDKDCLRFNCTLQSNVIDAVGLTPVEIKVYGELCQEKQKQFANRMVQ